jgi:hypothetical protein
VQLLWRLPTTEAHKRDSVYSIGKPEIQVICRDLTEIPSVISPSRLVPTPTVTGLGRPAEQPGLGGPVRVRRRLWWSQPELHSLHWQCGTGRRRRVRANRHRDWHCRPLARSAGLAPGRARDSPGLGHVTVTIVTRSSRSLTTGSVAGLGRGHAGGHRVIGGRCGHHDCRATAGPGVDNTETIGRKALATSESVTVTVTLRLWLRLRALAATGSLSVTVMPGEDSESEASVRPAAAQAQALSESGGPGPG